MEVEGGTGAGHVLLLDDAADLGLESHVQHAVSLVQGQVAAARQADAGALYQIAQAAGGGHQDVASPLHLPQLHHPWLVNLIDWLRAGGEIWIVRA